MGIALRCYHCKEWVHRTDNPLETCPRPCRKLRVSSDNTVRGLYSEFWNEDKDIHIVHEHPRGVE
jgi:hypothetical protein